MFTAATHEVLPFGSVTWRDRHGPAGRVFFSKGLSMNTKTAIQARAERCKCQYPKDRYKALHGALMGDPAAELEFIAMMTQPRRSLWHYVKEWWRQ